MKIELSKRDEDTDTESGNDSSEDGGGDGFRDFEEIHFWKAKRVGERGLYRRRD